MSIAGAICQGVYVGGVCQVGVPGGGDVCAPGGLVSQEVSFRMTDTCKNITLLQLRCGRLLCRYITAKIIIYLLVSVVCFVFSLETLPTAGF